MKTSFAQSKKESGFLGLIFLIASVILGNIVYSQDWVEKMQDPTVNFYETKASFDAFWLGKPIEKGKGYAVFKRWESVVEPRVYPSGDVSLLSSGSVNFENWLKNKKLSANYKSLTGNWTSIGPFGFSGSFSNGIGSSMNAGRINFVRFHPNNNNNIWVGAPDGGLWSSLDGGLTWSTNTDELSVIGVSELAIDPINPQIMYLATGDADGNHTPGKGVLKSYDSGLTWTNTGLNYFGSLVSNKISRILIDPINPQIVLVFSQLGIFRSTNGGTSFTNVFPGIIRDAEFKPGDSNTIYACGPSQFFKSVNNGLSWTTVNLPLNGIQRLSMAVSPANPSGIYLLASGMDSGFKGIMRSVNEGVTFNIQSTSPNLLNWSHDGSGTGGQSSYNLAIAVNPNNFSEVIVGGINQWKSLDGGINFNLLTYWNGGQISQGIPQIHADVHDIQFQPGANNTIFTATDGGLFKTTDGINWIGLNSNLAISQQYRLALSSSYPNMILTGHQDNGTNKTTDLITWNNMLGGDGMDCLIDWNNSNHHVYSMQNGNYFRYFNGAFEPISDPPGGTFISPIHQDPVNSNVIYAGGRKELYICQNPWVISPNLVSWQVLGAPFPPSENIIEFDISPSNHQVIYVLKNSKISKSLNGGQTFTSCTSPTLSVQPSRIVVSDLNPNVVFVTYSGYSANNKVFKSLDGGVTWINLSNGLPNVPVNCIVYQKNPDGGDRIYIGTDHGGIFYLDNSLNDWVDFSSGLPNCAIWDLEIMYSVSKIRAATFGRGAWESDLYDLIPISPEAYIHPNVTNTCQGENIQFTSLSYGIPTTYNWSFPGGTPSTSSQQNPVINYGSSGVYDVSLTITNANGTSTIIDTSLITISSYPLESLPFSEGFESFSSLPSQNWSIINPTGTGNWELESSFGSFPTPFKCVKFNNFNNPPDGDIDELRTPKIDFSNLSSALLTFDVAYAAKDSISILGPGIDGLEILVSYDCGANWTSIYYKTGYNIGIGNLPTASPMVPCFIPSNGQWRTDSVDLSLFINNPSIEIAFRNIEGNGNPIYLDNINITGTPPTQPIVGYTSNYNIPICIGDSIQFQSTSSGIPLNHNWSFQGGTPSTSTEPNPTVFYNTPGVFSVGLVVSNITGSDTLITGNYVVNGYPEVTLMLDVLDTVCFNYPFFELGGGVPPGGIFSGPGVNLNTFNPSAALFGINPITYSYSENGCMSFDMDSIYVDLCAKISNNSDVEFEIYPNPINAQMTISIDESLIGKEYSIFDQVGKLVSKGSLINANTKLSLNVLSNGIYTLQIEGKGRKTFAVQKD
jgi:PKD repeat protein